MQQQVIPVLFTDNFFIFPGCTQVVNLNLEGNERIRRVLTSSLLNAAGQVIILSSRKELPLAELATYEPLNFFNYGSLAKIKLDLQSSADVETVFNSLSDVQITGLDRVKILEITESETFQVYEASYQINREEVSDLTADELNEVNEKFVRQLPNLLKKTNLVPTSDNLSYLAVGDPSKLIDLIVQLNASMERDFKQLILQEYKLEKRLKLLFELEKRTRKFQQNINARVNEKLAEQQNAAYLREQLEEIQRQLDKLEGTDSGQDNYQTRLSQEPFPEDLKQLVRSELKNLQRMHPAEASVTRSHIELLMSIPWYQTTTETTDLQFAIEQLEKDHFGLQKVKERIIEHLAVIQQTGKVSGNVICLVGPPGVGKTSLAASVARATGRKFVKISVGGVSDESEIRGHRRTYVGAMPGKIVQAMKKAQVLNPVFLIDELDKIGGGGYHGDPTSALLEVLDPNQNQKFTDNYLGDIPYDLSKVLFICTANSTEYLSQPLLDRMEIIPLSAYTEIEKLQIATNYLIPKLLESSDLTAQQLTFKNTAITQIIRSFTREAGVRELARNFEKIIRKFIVKLLQKKQKKLVVSEQSLPSYLGKNLYDFTSRETAQRGIATGLAYTYGGGDILILEASCFPGKGELVLTGNLGAVMKESAVIALDYVKANSHLFTIQQEVFATTNVHIHVPEGAVPKDGPSAGITLVSAIASAFSGKLLPADIGMTGEITLRGRVLAIGGLREKALAAHRSGLKTIIIPTDNQKDLEDLPSEVKSVLKIILVSEYQEVWKILNS